jgi:integrase
MKMFPKTGMDSCTFAALQFLYIQIQNLEIDALFQYLTSTSVNCHRLLDAPWYAPVPIGKHSLQTMVKRMCEEANIEGVKTNHSLRATAETQMFEQGAPEKLIQERTGHRFLEGL